MSPEPPPKPICWRNETAQRLDRALQHQLPQYSRAFLQRLIHDGAVHVDRRSWRLPGRRLRGGELLRVQEPPPPAPLAAQALPLHWHYEDAQLAVLEKPAGLVVQPGAGQRDGTLVNALLARWPELRDGFEDPTRAGIVHRLDKLTSGLLIVARDACTQRALQDQFAARTVEKRYYALVERSPREARGVIDTPLIRDPEQRHRFRVGRGGKRAVSRYRTLADGFPRGRALLEIRPETGRTHQIRVQLAHLGCPVVGDRVYGYRKARGGRAGCTPERHFLHACGLGFTHPQRDERLTFVSPLPTAWRRLLQHWGYAGPLPQDG